MSVSLARVITMAVVFSVSVEAAATAQTDPFLAIDAYAGFLGHRTPSGDQERVDETGFRGFEVGSSVRFAPRMGIKVAASRTTANQSRVVQFAVGPELTTSYTSTGVRAFTHLLAGAASVRPSEGSSTWTAALVAGAGFDTFYVVRLQFDYLWLNLAAPESTTVGRHQLRVFIGGVVPMCLRRCRPDYGNGIDLSGQ